VKIATPQKRGWLPIGAALVLVAATIGQLSGTAEAADAETTLAGAHEVPSVKSAGMGTVSITVGTDKSVRGSVTTKGIMGTAAHIHEAPAGKNGPVIIPLVKNGDTYTVPAYAKLTDAQYASYKAGELYVNVHTTAYPDGEMRAQLKP
jgi:hypothetical protein